MIAAREWFVPLLDGKPLIDKPVLFHWFQSLLFLGFGTTEFAARLPTACAAVALLWITYWTGRELFDANTGRRAALMLVTMPATFALKNVALLDMVFTAFLFGAVACLVVCIARDRPHLQWAGYGLLTLATMIKGPVAVLLLAVAFGAAVLFARSCRPELSRLRWILEPSAAVALAAPWFLWMWWVFGDALCSGTSSRGMSGTSRIRSGSDERTTSSTCARSLVRSCRGVCCSRADCWT